MTTVVGLNSETCSAGEILQQSQDPETSVASPPGPEVTIPRSDGAATTGKGSALTRAPVENRAKASTTKPTELSASAEKTPAGETGRDNLVGSSSVGNASSDTEAVTPLGRALAALERRDYATARQLFEGLGRKDVVEAIGNALAALDRKDYATAESLFDALALSKPASSAGGPIPSDSPEKARYKPANSPVAVAPVAEAADRRGSPQAQEAKAHGLKRVLLRTGLVLFGIFCASAIYAPPWTFAAIKSQAIAGLVSTVDLVKAPLEAITGQSEREEQRTTMRDLGAALTQVTIRLDQIEHVYGARMDRLGEHMDQNASLAARLDALETDASEKKVAVPAAPASELADITTRLNKLEKSVSAAPASESADIMARLSRLEKRAAVPAASLATPLPPVAPKQLTVTSRAEPSASYEIARLESPLPLLRDYRVEGVWDGVAIVYSRYGPQEVALGDYIPGAGRVLRIERRGGNWFVVTSRGAIASGRAPE
jgi:hypothetical protein